MGFLLCIFDSIINYIILPLGVASIAPFITSFFVLFLYVKVRYNKNYSAYAIIATFLSIIVNSIVWIFNGGMDGITILVAFVVFILALVYIPTKYKVYLLIFFIGTNLALFYLQINFPNVIVPYPTAKDHWIDYIATVILCTILIYLTINFVHKNYILEHERAKDNERMFKSLSENSQDNISRFDRQYRHLYTNRAKIALTELSKAAIIGKSYKELKIFNEEQTTMIENMIENVFNFRQQFSILLEIEKNATKTVLDYRFYPELDENNSVISVLGVSRDITELKQTNAQLSQLNIDKDRFISILAHDIKNPFNSILGFLDLLSTNIQNYDREKTEKLIHIINDKAIITHNLLDEILTWGRAHSGKIPFQPQSHDFLLLCNSVVEQLLITAQHKEIGITVKVTEDLIIYGDINMLKTILRNLISNAIKFSRIGGHITISAEQKKEQFNFKVADNGVGIEKEVMIQLFDISKVHTTIGTAN